MRRPDLLKAPAGDNIVPPPRPRLHLALAASLALLGACDETTARGDGGGSPGDAGAELTDGRGSWTDGAPDGPPTGASFGEGCSNIGELCSDGLSTCVAFTEGAASGFCSKPCSALQQECTGSPEGTRAACILLIAGGDAGISGNYCAFVCAWGGETASCPAALTCSTEEVPPTSGTNPCLP